MIGASNYINEPTTISWIDWNGRTISNVRVTSTTTITYQSLGWPEYQAFRFLDPFGRGWRTAIVTKASMKAMMRELSRVMSAAELERPAIHKRRFGEARCAAGVQHARRRASFPEASMRASRRRIHRRA